MGGVVQNVLKKGGGGTAPSTAPLKSAYEDMGL